MATKLENEMGELIGLLTDRLDVQNELMEKLWKRLGEYRLLVSQLIGQHNLTVEDHRRMEALVLRTEETANAGKN